MHARPLMCQTPSCQVLQITVKHEIGHYLGLDEDDLERRVIQRGQAHDRGFEGIRLVAGRYQHADEFPGPEAQQITRLADGIQCIHLEQQVETERQWREQQAADDAAGQQFQPGVAPIERMHAAESQVNGNEDGQWQRHLQ